jgi:transcriptional regulator with XRE-family HTH domain
MLNNGGSRLATGGKRFGEFVRDKRLAKGLGLREMAKMVGVSATYMSKIERDEFQPPAEDKVRTIAEIIGSDADELLALSGRISSDLSEIIKQHPREISELLRTTMGLKVGVISSLTQRAKEAKETAGAEPRPKHNDVSIPDLKDRSG